MTTLNQVLLILHFLGLAMGLSVSIGNIVVLNLIDKAAPPEKAVLARFPPAISRVGRVGLVVLWATGLAMAYTKWSGIGSMPWTFHVKLAAVIALTGLVIYITRLEARIHRGDLAAAATIQTVGKMTSACALIAIIFAVLTFD
ncbi:MAG TPA: hypothetical protein VM032_16275 [Vicinamibacterales bacterium]|nr:hypothetical protein [Vicinamibacterales bacterium]